MIRIRRALVSVSDKSGVAELCAVLHGLGVEIVSSGGTAAALRDAGIPVTDVSALSGNPEAFGGRMKTISFAIESALLFDRERDAREAERLAIVPIDMVVCNLYPFTAARDAGGDDAVLAENIDIGGPTMIRAGAKNWRFVAVLTSPAQYGAVSSELLANGGALGHDTRSRLMRDAFNHTADYDAAIACEMDRRAGRMSMRFAFRNGRELRYGENPHQKAWLLRDAGAVASLFDMEHIRGAEVSYNNVVDIHAALEAVFPVEGIACAVVKHTNPCGLASAPTQRAAFEAAWAGDPMSAFGSVVAFNSRVEEETLRFLELDNADRNRRRFVEAVVAPDFSAQAVALASVHKNLRLVRVSPDVVNEPVQVKLLAGACLAQGRDVAAFEKLEMITASRPEALDVPLVQFGIGAVRCVKSNAIVVVRRKEDGTMQLLGMGAGQPNRLTSIRLALDRCRDNLAAEHSGTAEALDAWMREQLGRCVLVSDAFFPFPDNIELMAARGIRLAVQPGGSLRDKAVIAACDALGVAMVMTGVRHFRH
ncbi:MAG: bifunctional phosphoribosylaminoimidazolecarboxamide formyltransferase/IMP cyclohydrolase [Deltaproteobacteria bacterium]|nr:bifunctional phosphoribosylaminoimidazolecarboxamide formyltransferase/IMP cyclohydrolase [Deltaproteobacteria bacterium]